MNNIYEGDPKIILTEDGANMVFRSGQPIMDGGLENAVILALFTVNFAGNVFLRNKNSRFGSAFVLAAQGPITLASVNRVRNTAELALQSLIDGNVAESVEVTVSNPSGSRIEVSILIKPKGKTLTEILLAKNGVNWIIQARDPAYRKVV